MSCGFETERHAEEIGPGPTLRISARVKMLISPFRMSGEIATVSRYCRAVSFCDIYDVSPDRPPRVTVGNTAAFFRAPGALYPAAPPHPRHRPVLRLGGGPPSLQPKRNRKRRGGVPDVGRPTPPGQRRVRIGAHGRGRATTVYGSTLLCLSEGTGSGRYLVDLASSSSRSTDRTTCVTVDGYQRPPRAIGIPHR